MLKQFKLLFIALFLGTFIVACSDDNSAQTDSKDTSAAPAEMTSEDTTDTTGAVEDETDTIAGMTKEDAIAKWGEPDVTQTHTIDALTVDHLEWHKKDGITSVQFHNGVAQFSQFVPAE
ncbi:MAG: hypothetical protein VX829_01870 [Pseudomonadota bacterium]|nr:hypothetical protein [Pseudomonadota bacterium]